MNVVCFCVHEWVSLRLQFLHSEVTLFLKTIPINIQNRKKISNVSGSGEKLKKKMKSINSQITRILLKTLGLEAPIVWLENERGNNDNEDDDDDRLERDGDFTLLPDGSRYF